MVRCGTMVKYGTMIKLDKCWLVPDATLLAQIISVFLPLVELMLIL